MSSTSKLSAGTRLPEIRARPFDRARDPRSSVENLLSQKQQIEFRSIATVLDCRQEGTTIFSEGEDARFVYSVAAGVVRIGRTSDGGRRQILAFMLPGDLFGLPDAGSYVNSADVACPSTLYRIPWAQLRELMMREPAVQHNLLIKVAHDFREAQRRIVMLGQQNTYQRLASFLLDFVQHPAFFDERHRCLTLPLSRFDIADYLGTAAETIARGFLRLEHDGLVRRITSRSIEIRNLDGLRQLQMRRRRSGG
ncbi:MAG: helix-turn-helix domain-containing protein [Alphaproteobacteria bacterium]|nr:helix-turn-helix domain-containing protein [Alphaproteobacteria bacterium]MDE2111389.1 helix-turn-helix domain-containing protein [Alphaproteobacteria bacterium]MDE2495558.1 helix-turn-helix domain-containing protein [Alphaproteobacteria bacterium]